MLEAVPDPDPESSLIWSSVSGKRFEKYGEFVALDSLCKAYGYTHEQVFKLSWVEAMTMILYNREFSYVDHKARQISRNARKKQ